jgi:uncharacterized protein YbjT (DUF2867 family)
MPLPPSQRFPLPLEVMNQRVVVTGANSAVGRAMFRLAARCTRPTTLVAAVRSPSAFEKLPPQPPEQGALISYDDPLSLSTAFAGASAVVHLAGTLIERHDSTYETANVQTAKAVAAAAERCALKKVVLVSAIDADAQSQNRYWRTKGEAEAAVRNCGCAHTILRAPLLLGPGTEGTLALVRHLSHRSVALPGGGRHRQQPLHVDDLARATLAASDPAVATNRTLDLVGPVSLADRDIVERAARLVGRHIRVRTVPIPLIRTVLRIRRAFGMRGFSPDVLEVITTGTDIDPSPAARELGIVLTGLDEMIADSLAVAAPRR